MIEWIIYLVIGVVAGLSAGLFGLGGGLIVVPALAMVYQWQAMDANVIMHVAVGTSLMTIIITSLSSAYSHARYRHINWNIVTLLTPALLIGALVGTYLLVSFSSRLLQQCFAIYMLFAAIKIWLPSPAAYSSNLLNKGPLLGFGTLTGTISALIGIGGGTLIVPYLLTAKQSIKQAIGTAAACGFPIAVSAVIGFSMLDSDFRIESTVWRTGFIDWKAFVGIISTSIIFARVGASMTKRLPVTTLQYIFSIVLLIVAVKMWLETTL